MEQLNRLMGWLEKLGEKLGTSVEALAPHAFNYTRWRGVGYLVLAAMTLVAAAWFCRAGRNAWAWARSDIGKGWAKANQDIAPPAVGAVVLQLIALGLGALAARLFMCGFPAVVEPVGATVHAILSQ